MSQYIFKITLTYINKLNENNLQYIQTKSSLQLQYFPTAPLITILTGSCSTFPSACTRTSTGQPAPEVWQRNKHPPEREWTLVDW